MSAVAVHHEAVGPTEPTLDPPTVVLSNSLGADHHMWDGQMALLARHAHVIRYDTRGHGLSPVPDGPYSIDDLADDLVALLDTVGVGRAHLVGLSLGGMTAMRVAARNPHRVDRLVVLCSSAHLPPAQGWKDRAQAVRSGGSESVVDAVVEGRWYTAAFVAREPEHVARAKKMFVTTSREGYAACCEAIADMDLRQDLPSITAPTLAIAGVDDPATPPPHLEAIATAVRDGRVVLVPDAAHLANDEQPDTVGQATVAHLGLGSGTAEGN
jgi:3-oxoadipate enol-lactonase